MEKREKRLFILSGIMSLILMLGSIMALLGNFSSSDGFNIFMVINSMSIIGLLILGICLILKKNNYIIGALLIFNLIVSILNLIFGFTVQEFFITLSTLLIIYSIFFRNKNFKYQKYTLLIILLCSSLVVVSTLIGFIKHSNNEIHAHGSLILDFNQWLYYFSPLMYAIFYFLLITSLGLIYNNSIVGERINKCSYIPLIIFVVCTIITLITSLCVTTITYGFNNVLEILLLTAVLFIIIAFLIFPFNFIFLNENNE